MDTPLNGIGRWWWRLVIRIAFAAVASSRDGLELGIGKLAVARRRLVIRSAFFFRTGSSSCPAKVFAGSTSDALEIGVGQRAIFGGLRRRVILVEGFLRHRLALQLPD
jgi:hypothetical protein